MSCFFALLLIAVCVLAVFALGIIVGIADCKRSYGISKGVTPEEFNHQLEEVYEMAYANWKEVDDGCIYP